MNIKKIRIIPISKFLFMILYKIRFVNDEISYVYCIPKPPLPKTKTYSRYLKKVNHWISGENPKKTETLLDLAVPQNEQFSKSSTTVILPKTERLHGKNHLPRSHGHVSSRNASAVIFLHRLNFGVTHVTPPPTGITPCMDDFSFFLLYRRAEGNSRIDWIYL